jgi:molybdopterin converting factor small subunit
MVIRFFGPFAKLATKESQLKLEDPITLRELIDRLSSRFSGFAAYAGAADDTELSAYVIFIRNGRYLKLADQIADEDTIDVVLPATGG